jgi:predicted permease
MALVYRVEPGYLKTMEIPLRQGRFFTNDDNERAQPVVVIDEVFAKKHFGHEDPIGRRVHLEGMEPAQIVGVIGHVKQWRLDSSNDDFSLQAQLYQPFRQLPDSWLRGGGTVGVVARLSDPSTEAWTAVLSSIRRVVQIHNKQNVIFAPQTMNEVIANTLSKRRFSMILLEAFSVVALLLASVGLYGVISYLVGQRTHELGVRIALGAQRQNVLRLVLGQGMRMTIAGMILGLISALGLTRLLVTLLYGVSATDPLTFAAISLLLLGVAVLACLIPAWRATKLDPLVALRYE